MEAVHDSVFGCGSRNGAVAVTKLDRVSDDLALGIHLNQLVTAVQVKSWAYVEPVLSPEVPRLTGGRFGMDEDTTTHRGKWSLVEIERAIEEVPRQETVVEERLS